MLLEIELKPMAPYFFGTEKGAYHEDNNHVSSAVLNPYYLKSAQLPSQTTLFGVLRYVGIRNPQGNFALTDDDKANIGEKGYTISDNPNSFGRIKSISPMFLRQYEGGQAFTWVPAPSTTVHYMVNEETNDIETATLLEYAQINTLSGERYIPINYKEKEANFGRWLCLDADKLRNFPAKTEVRVGINRSRQREGRANRTEQTGFFKKEYYVLDAGWCFLFYAEVDEEFFVSQDAVVYLGQGKSPFSIKITKKRDKKWRDCVNLKALNKVLPNEIKVNGDATPVHWEYCISDCCLTEPLDSLKASCKLLLGTSSDHRTFTTNYKITNAGMKGRFIKGSESLHFLAAGSVLLFAEDQPENKSTESNTHAQIAGFNELYSTKGE